MYILLYVLVYSYCCFYMYIYIIFVSCDQSPWHGDHIFVSPVTKIHEMGNTFLSPVTEVHDIGNTFLSLMWPVCDMGEHIFVSPVTKVYDLGDHIFVSPVTEVHDMKLEHIFVFPDQSQKWRTIFIVSTKTKTWGSSFSFVLSNLVVIFVIDVKLII